jgi:ubiquitin-protein ligase
MGDPLSATAVVLSLPGIFMSCVQCFELIQRGRNFERDLLVLTTKFSNQQLRFTKWGEACGFGSASGYHQGLDAPALKINIERTLESIKLLLDSGVVVTRTYQGLPDDAVVRPQAVHARWSWTAIRSQIRSSRASRSTKNATRWALSDKTKLDEIVRHLHDLIGDLEVITADLGVPERQRYLVQYEIQSISDTETLELLEASRLDSDDIISDAASARLQSLRTGFHPLSQQPDSIWEILSVADTNRTTESYATAPESAIWDQKISVLESTQNARIMKGLLCMTGPTSTSLDDLIVDTSAIGSRILGLRPFLDAFDQTVANHPHLFQDAGIRFQRQAIRRITWEMRDYHKGQEELKLCWHHLHLIGDNFRHVLGSIEGPVNSPYAGGLFHVIIRVSDRYPLTPPWCLMLTRVYHPNVNPAGEICLDILDQAWNAVWTLETMLLALVVLLENPGLEDPLVPEIAELYIRDRSAYEENARLYTHRYANEVSPTPELLQRFVGICEELGEKGEEPSST